MRQRWGNNAGRWALALMFGLSVAGTVLAAEVPEESKFVQGTAVNGLGISGMTVEEATGHISSFYANEYRLTIHERGGVQEVVTGAEIGFTAGLPCGMLQEILQNQNASGRAFGPSVDNSHRIELQNTYSEEMLTEQINGLNFMTGNGIVATSDARVSDYQAGQAFTIVPEIWGNNVNQEKAVAAVRNAVATGMTELDLETAGCYFQPNVFSDSAELRDLCESMNRCRSMSVTYQFGEVNEVLDSATICSWLMGTANGQIQVNRDLVAAYVKTLAEKYDTAGRERVFRTVAGVDVNLTGPYGWKINQAAETDALIGLIQAAQSQKREPVYATRAVVRVPWDSTEQGSTEQGSTTQDSTIQDNTVQEWGTTYAEVDLTGQHVYMIKEGAVVWDAPCVTGNLSKKYDTPAGIYSLTYKERDRVLRGEKQPDGTYEYESPVSYWMPFNGGIGFHDANWRGSFGGEIYKTSGSHGCVNLPPDRTGALYDLVYTGVPVICY